VENVSGYFQRSKKGRKRRGTKKFLDFWTDF